MHRSTSKGVWHTQGGWRVLALQPEMAPCSLRACLCTTRTMQREERSQGKRSPNYNLHLGNEKLLKYILKNPQADVFLRILSFPTALPFPHSVCTAEIPAKTITVGKQCLLCQRENEQYHKALL